MSNPFVHLHCHSHYSLLDGANRLPELVTHVKSLGMNAVALTDHGNLYGAIELYQEATKAGVRPIIGYEAYVAPGKRTEKEHKGAGGEYSYHLTMLAHNEQGFKNLIKMSSSAFLDGFYYRPRIDKEMLEAYSEGITVLSGCLASELATLMMKEDEKEAKKLIEWYQKVFKNNFYIEVQNNGLDIQTDYNERVIRVADKMGLPLVATCDAHYLTKEDNIAHDVLLCINTGRLRADENRMRYGSDQFYIRTPEEMYKLFPKHGEAVKRTQEIADKCELTLDFKKRHFPVFTPPGKEKADNYLRKLAQEGLIKRYGKEPSQAAKDRLELEVNVVLKLGFASYFLIVWDFVRFAEEKKIPAGARGSACGSVLSYVLGISQVDPLEYDLLFERFLDPNRAEAPDIDIDFCQERREEVLAYVRQKYGEESVAQIATFGTLAARAAIKDVGRALGVPLDKVNQLSNLIPKVPIGISISESMEKVGELRTEYERDKLIHEMLDIAMKLEGTNRNIGTHAAGVVIADGPITDYVPIQKVASKADKGDEDGEKNYVITTQWTMLDLAKVGLLKMDFLGLRTLTVLDKALGLIKKHQNVVIDIAKLPLDDKPTYTLLASGRTQGVFQFESEGIRNLLRSLKPDNIRDIIASTALYRPGPLKGGMVDSYINRKHGKEKPTYDHPLIEEVLTETYGVMVYQEQVMRILNRLGGLELPQAYACIKAISKKDTAIIDQRRAGFIKGALERGVQEEVAKDIFEKIVFFGGYGFNKSHSAAYALVSYQTAYLKAHYPAEFMAAVLTSEIGDIETISEHIRNSREMQLEILPPDVNESDPDFSVISNNQVRFGLVAIRGFGRKAAEALVEERKKHGPFRDLFDMCERLDQRMVPRSGLETLIKAGALDRLESGNNRAALLLALPAAIQEASSIQADKRSGQMNMFDSPGKETDSGGKKKKLQRSLPNAEMWPLLKQLMFEKEAVGFYLSSHPLAQYEDVIALSSQRISDIERLSASAELMLAGMIVDVVHTNAKRSRSGETRMARFLFEDMTGNISCVIFPDAFSAYKNEIENDKVCFIKASVDRSRDKPGLIVNKIITMEQGRKMGTRGMLLRFISGNHEPELVTKVGAILKKHRGQCPVYLEVTDLQGRRAQLKLGSDFNVDPERVPLSDLKMMLGNDQVSFMGPAMA